MKFSQILLIVSLVVIHTVSSADSKHGMYYNELKALKKSPATKEIFDKDAHPELSAIHRDIGIYKNLTGFQRFVRAAFLALDVVIVTPDTLPTLYGYVDRVCKQAKIATPTVFVTRHAGFLGAAAQKFFMSTGCIVIGQKLLRELSDDAIEGVVAHEIGHIKHNHGNKKLALWICTIPLYIKLSHLFINKIEMLPTDTLEEIRTKCAPAVVIPIMVKSYILLKGVFLLPSLIVNKRFEKEADEFACKNNGKSKGIIEFFELILQKDELRDQEFVAIYDLLQKNKADLEFGDYYFDLIIRYYLAKGGHLYNKAYYKYVYYNTFVGPHPSPQARIAAAKKYLPRTV